jgi:hypothetical protein
MDHDAASGSSLRATASSGSQAWRPRSWVGLAAAEAGRRTRQSRPWLVRTTWAFSPTNFQADMGVLLVFMFVVDTLGALILPTALGCCSCWKSRSRRRVVRKPRSALGRADKSQREAAADGA